MAELYTGVHKHPKSSRLLTGIADLLQEPAAAAVNRGSPLLREQLHNRSHVEVAEVFIDRSSENVSYSAQGWHRRFSSPGFAARRPGGVALKCRLVCPNSASAKKWRRFRVR